MNKDRTQQLIRQRARFLCENPECRKSTAGQYAHIIPESSPFNGKFDTENILFLCNDCHRKFDYSILKRNNPLALKYLELLKKAKKPDDKIEHLFYFFTDSIVVKIGSGILLHNCHTIFRTPSNEPILSVKLENGKLLISGNLYDQQGNLILQINENKFITHGDLLWDLYVNKQGELHLISKDKAIEINITQDLDSSLRLEGKLFIEGGYFLIDKEEGIVRIDPPGLRLNENYGDNGIVLSGKVIAF